MDQTTPIILLVTPSAQDQVTIETSDGYRYVSDLSGFSKVFCYPKTREDWNNVFIDSDGLGLIWSSRFEVHVDQVIAAAVHKEMSASGRNVQV